ncbi:hypothetical protein M9H77_21628 [Catharanthus roseus]|uniref:Uncharacterized protein n=1 Tax=Catharanthus roseus TaxID=4058 RepID=A0ACC0AN46_CATRO|nr:hypothetical protein M9H77_21628 [Catharanthus roseus]
MFFKSDPYKTDITTIVKRDRIHLDLAIPSQILGELREATSASDVIKDSTIKLNHYYWDEYERRWRLTVQQRGDEQAQAAEEQVADVVEDDDFHTTVIDWLGHLQIWQEEIQHQLEIHKENRQYRFQSVEQMMQHKHEMFSYLYWHFSSDAMSSGGGVVPRESFPFPLFF